jgi:hypothetical protein
MPFRKGQSGNPNGRPPNERVLTKILERALSKTEERDGSRVARKRIMADMAAEAVINGKVTFPDGAVLELGPKEWVDFVQWVYKHVDGPPRQEVDMTSGGQPIEISVKLVNDG